MHHTKRCPTCPVATAVKPITEFAANRSRSDGHEAQCAECRRRVKRAKTAKTAQGADELDERVLAETAARAARLASDTEALRPEDFDVAVGNDGKRDPNASKEKRQEFSRAMGAHAQSLRRAAITTSEGTGELADAMPPEAGTYIAKLAEQERRFGNRRLARSVSLAAAGEALALASFKQAAAEFLSDKITPTGYAREHSDKPAKRSVCLLLSDLHLGAELSSLDNPMPFRAVEEARRLEYVVRQLLDYKPQYRDNSEAVLILNGDIIEGQLMHDFRDGAPLAEQKVIFWRYFRMIVGLVAQQYPSVRVVCQPGNHGRDLVRHPGRATSRKWDSHETELYWGLKEMCAGLLNVTWQIDFRAVSIVDLHGSKLGVTHGDTEVKLAHPDTAAAKNAATFDRINATRLYGAELDAWVIGHFHSARYVPRTPLVLYNGALVPPNGYARTAGYIGEDCGQWLWEAVEGYPIGDLRFVKVGREQDIDENLGTLIQPFRFPNS